MVQYNSEVLMFLRRKLLNMDVEISDIIFLILKLGEENDVLISIIIHLVNIVF